MTLTVMGYAQQAPQYSFNMFNHLAVNPGFAGANGGICARGIYHEQWLGFEDAPNTMVLAVDMDMKSINSGMGLNIIQDNSGYNKNLYLNANYAYHLKVGSKGNLGLGLSLGLVQNAIGGEWVTPDQLGNPNVSYSDDRLIPQQESHLVFDAGFGAFYSTTFDKYNQMYAGISMAHLTEPKFVTDGGGEGNYLGRVLYLSAGYYYTMPNGLIQLRPSIFLKSEFSTTQLDVNLTALYNQMFWAGVTYRGSGDLGIMVGLTLKNNLSFGLAYDYHLANDLKTSGSIDAMLKYCFSLSKRGGRTSHKSVRFL